MGNAVGAELIAYDLANAFNGFDLIVHGLSSFDSQRPQDIKEIFNACEPFPYENDSSISSIGSGDGCRAI